jgi:hypothetical protein
VLVEVAALQRLIDSNRVGGDQDVQDLSK